MPDYSDYVLDDYNRPILGAKVALYSENGQFLIDTATTNELGQFTVTGPSAKSILVVSYGGLNERSLIIVGDPPEYVGPSGPAFATFFTVASFKDGLLSNKIQVLATPAANPGIFTWETAEAPYTAAAAAQPANYIESNIQSFAVGAWQRLGAATIRTSSALTLQAKLDQGGTNVSDKGALNNTAAAAAFSAAFTAANDVNNPYPVIRSGKGAWLSGTAMLTLSNIRASVRGEGISATYWHTTVPAAATAYRFQNFGGIVDNMTFDAGLPADAGATARLVARNGVWFDWFGGHGTIRSVEARWFNGFGFKFDTVWDSTLENIITVGCGSNTEAAVQMVSTHSDTINHTNIQRLQIEDSVGKALLIENSLNLVIDGFHCEGTIGSPGVTSITMKGGNNTYRNGRIANDGGNVTAILGGGNCSWEDYAWETGTVVDYSWNVSDDNQRSRMIGCVYDTFRVQAPSNGKLQLIGCVIANLILSDQPDTVEFIDCTIGNVTLNGNTTTARMEGCRVTGTWALTGNPTLYSERCRFTNAPKARTWISNNDDVVNAFTTEFAQFIRADTTRFGGNVTLDSNGAKVILTGQSRIAGNAAYNAGTAYGALGGDVAITGSVNANWYGTGGTFEQGVMRWRPDATTGQPFYHKSTGAGFNAGPNVP